MVRSAICLVGIPLILCALSGRSAGAGQPITLGGYLPQYVVSPDQSRLIFQNGDDLYSARTDGVGSPVRISEGKQIFFLYDSHFSPDSSWFVYKSEQVVDEVPHVQIYSSPTDGSGTPILLSSTTDDYDPENVNTVAPENTLGISADSRYVAMRIKRQDSSTEMLSRRIDGSAAAISLSNGLEVGSFETVDQPSRGRVAGNRVLFSSDDGLSSLYSGVFDGSAPTVPLGDPPLAQRAFALSPDQSKVALSTTLGTTQSLYISPVSGGPLTLLASAQDQFAFDPQYIGGMKFNPDGSRVVYRKGSTIWSVRTNGAAPAVEIVPNRDGWESRNLEISPDGKTLAYTRLPPQSPANSMDLYVTPIDGNGPATHLWKNVGGIERLDFAPDGKHLLFQEFRPVGNGNGWFLWTAPTDGSKPAVELGRIFQYQPMPDGQSVIIAQDLNQDWLIEGFYQVPIEGGEPRLLVANPLPDGGIDAFSGWQLIDNGTKIVFIARDADYHFEIFVAAIPEPGSLAALISAAAMLSLRCPRRR